jgi:hypothetical protein
MAHVLLVANAVVAVFNTAQSIPGYVELADDDIRFLAYITPTVQQIADAQRRADIDAAIAGDVTIQSLKAMTNAEYDLWFTQNVASNAQAIQVLKRCLRVVLRRVV